MRNPPPVIRPEICFVRSLPVFCGILHGIGNISCGCDAHLTVGVNSTKCLHRSAMGQKQLMGHRKLRIVVGFASRCMKSRSIPKLRTALRFIQRHKPMYPVMKPFRCCLRILGKSKCRIRVEPAALLVKAQGQIPVIQGHAGFNPRFQQRIYQAVIEIQARGVDFPLSFWQNSGPTQ